MFDIKLQALDFQVITDEAQDQLEVACTIGLLLPVGPGQVAPIPAGILRLPIDRDAALAYSQELKEAAEALPKKSDIQVATSLEGVERAAKIDQDLRG